jgi:chromosome segregation ATPase
VLDCPQNGSDKFFVGLNELSGGEKTLLAMSFILSTATFKKRSLYIFDEVDAGKRSFLDLDSFRSGD